MSNENKLGNMENHQLENSTNLAVEAEERKLENSTAVNEKDAPLPKPCDLSDTATKSDKSTDKNTGIAIKNIESESLNSLLVYDSDSDSSSFSEMMKLNLNWQARDGSEESSTSSSSSSSSDDDDSETSSEDEEATPQPNHGENRGAIRKNMGPPKTDADLEVEKLPPVPDLSTLNINVENEHFVHIGNVLGIVDKLVTVAAIPNSPAYDLDTLLFLDNGKRPLGFVFDVLGQVTSPIYAIRFNSVDDIKNLGIQIETKVYSAPTSKHTQYVFLQQLLKMKGSDASWTGDSEVPPEFADYSDDEHECYHRYGNKKLSPNVKRAHSGDNYKKFESTMNRRNILNTKFNRYMDSYKQARLNKAKSKRPQINSAVPVFDPSVPPPNLAFYHQPTAGSVQVVPPEYVGMVYDFGGENNNSGSSGGQGFAPNFFMNNFVSHLTHTNSANYFTNHVGDNHPGPGPSHQ